MYKTYRSKARKCLYMPDILIDEIERRAIADRESFNRIAVDVLLREFIQDGLFGRENKTGEEQC